MRSVFLLFYVFLAHFCVDFYMGVWPVYKSVAGIDLATAGIIFGLVGFFGDGLQLVTGIVGDRGYRRRGVLLGVLLAAGAHSF